MIINKLYSILFRKSYKNIILFFIIGYCIISLFVLYLFQLASSEVFLNYFILIFFISLIFILLISYFSIRYFKSIKTQIKSYIEGKSGINKQKPMIEISEILEDLNQYSKTVQLKIDEKIAYENFALLGEFAAFVIHDLKNPISGIHLLAEGLNKRIDTSNELKKYSNEILLASQKLDDFIKKTLEMAKPETLNLRKINIVELIENVINDVNFTEIMLEKKFDDTVIEITADYQLLHRAIKNIVNNAIESIETNGKIQIEIIKNNTLSIKIADNGEGIEESKQKSVFKPFYTSKGKGHGLGLAMAKKVVLMHQGTLRLESKIGKGSTFIISIPFNNNIQSNVINFNSKE